MLSKPHSSRSISDKWIKAAIIGSVWASFEIVVGSFLHNMRIPFAGTSLAAISVFLLISFMQLWRDTGIILRAGIVCALMKSISPSAIILGPMLGIFMEALLLEAVVWLFGRNLIGFLLAGAVAVSWTLIQKILNLIILYGFDLVKAASSFFQFVAKQFSFISSNPSSLIILIFTVYGIVGGLAAMAGYYSSKNFHLLSKPYQTKLNLRNKNQSNLFSIDPSQKYSILNLVLILFTVVLNLYFINRAWLVLAAISGITFMVFCAIRYKRSLRHLKKPTIWIQFLVITLLAAFFWEWFSTGNYFTENGLRVGLEMNYRALIIIFGFSAISVELRNPLIKALLFQNGFKHLYAALNLAFSALPAIIDQLPGPRYLFKHRSSLIRNLLFQSEQLYDYFSKKNGATGVFMITGEVHEGKTTFVEKIISLLRAKNIYVTGFLSKGHFYQGKRQAFSLYNISTERSVPLAKANEMEGWLKFRSFWFNPRALTLGNQILSFACKDSSDIIVIDEVGPMELDGQGWHTSLLKLSTLTSQVQIWVVRNSIIEEVIQKYELINPVIINIGTNSPEAVLSLILQSKFTAC